MLLTCAEMKAVEGRAFADGVTAESLMEEAGAQIADVVAQFFPKPGRCAVFFGKGHNGGDALVAARQLAARGWEILLQPAFPEKQWSPLAAQKHREFSAGISHGQTRTDTEVKSSVREIPCLSVAKNPFVVLDGLLGIGAGGALREPIRGAAREINRLRVEEHAEVFAIDLPTGLDVDSGEADADAVVADFTLTIGFAKRGLLTDAATHFVGRLAVLPLAEFTRRAPEKTQEAEVAMPPALAPLLARRSFDAHKGDFGRVGIIAGSPGFSGAAVMAAEACLHAGAGLITLYVPAEILSLIVPGISPEIMVRARPPWREIAALRHDVLAIGPGLGQSSADEVLRLLEQAPQPMIIDADALNILARQTETLTAPAGPRLLTPHPGEMARLLGLREGEKLPSRGSRAQIAREFTDRFPVTLLLKGARTVIAEKGRPLSYNSTGHPGMATGGMGDVLTGVCAALSGQKLALYDAARLGAWVCGRAAELAVAGGESAESLSATHVVAHLGKAFRASRAGGW